MRKLGFGAKIRAQRRRLRIGAAAALLVAVVASEVSAVPGTLPRGDVEPDGRFDSADALALERHLEGVAGAALDARGLYAADVAPLNGSGVSQPDGKVDLGDLVVMLRMLGGEVGAPAPVLDALPSETPSANPYTSPITGTTAPGAVVHLYARNASGVLVHVDTVTADAGGVYSFPSVPLLFEGTNEFFTVAVDGSGLPGAASAPRSATWTSTLPCNPSGSTTVTVSGTQVWTAQCSAYTIGNRDLNVTGTLILGPGVTVSFNDSNDGFTVATGASLRAYGAPSQRVVLTSSATSWEGLSVATGNANSVLSHTLIEKAASSSTTYALNVSGANTVLPIRDSEIVSSAGRGMQVTTGKVAIEWSTISGSGTGSATIGVYLNSAALSTISYSKLLNYGTCLWIQSGAKHRIAYTEIDSTNAGVFLSASAAELFPGNWFHHNATAISVSSENCGSNGSCWRLSRIPTVRNSRFDNNTTNLTASNSDRWLDELETTRVVMDARENYWGSANPTTIAGKITDVTDQLGFSRTPHEVDYSDGLLVDWTPFLDTASGPVDYTYVSGHMELDFVAGAPALRKAVGPMLLRKTKTATIPAGTTIEAYVDPNLDTNGNPKARVDNLISGTLIVDGAAGSEVDIRAPGASPKIGSWWGFRFDTDSTLSALRHVRIRHAMEAIRATDTDISIDGAEISLFSRKAIVLERVTNSTGPPAKLTEVLDSVIDGTIDEGPPLETLKDYPVARHIVGIQIIDSFDNCTPSTCGSISGNTIRRLVTGIHVAGNSDPLILDNEISENVWGIWLQRLASGQPNPVINQNRLFANQGATPIPYEELQEDHTFRLCSNLGGSNLCLSDYQTSGTATLIDGKQNYWGVLTQQSVRDSIKIAEGERVAVDISEFTDDAAPPNIVGATDLLSLVLVDIGATGGALVDVGAPVIRPTLFPAETLTVSYSLQRAADVQVEIFREPDDTTTATPQYSFAVQSQAAGGPYTRLWDGKDAAGHWVPDGAYVYVITARQPGTSTVIDRYDPPRNQNRSDPSLPGDYDSIIGDRGSGNIGAGTLSTFNSFVNDYLTYNYVLEEYASFGHGKFASTVTAKVYHRPSGTGACDAAGTFSGDRVATVWLNKPLWVGTHVLLWDGRADATEQSPNFTPGQLIPEGPAGGADFCMFFETPGVMKRSLVIVGNTLPKITGTGTAPEIEVKSDPYWIQPSYEQSSALKFKLDQSAFVKLYILPPDQLSLGSALTFFDIDGDPNTAGIQAVPATTPFTYHWKGYAELGGAGETNELVAQSDGTYTFALEARNAQDQTLISVYRGVLEISGEGEAY